MSIWIIRPAKRLLWEVEVAGGRVIFSLFSICHCSWVTDELLAPVNWCLHDSHLTSLCMGSATSSSDTYRGRGSPQPTQAMVLLLARPCHGRSIKRPSIFGLPKTWPSCTLLQPSHLLSWENDAHIPTFCLQVFGIKTGFESRHTGESTCITLFCLFFPDARNFLMLLFPLLSKDRHR